MTYTPNTSNELTATNPGVSYNYDHDGNLTSKSDGTQYTWDAENRLTQVTLPSSGGTVNFKYDPFGRRVQKSFTSGAGTTVTWYVYDGENLMEEVDSTGNVLARYTRSTNIDEPLAMLRNGTTSYYEQDGLGSVSSLSNSGGALANTYSFDTYGNLTASAGTIVNSFRYTGREFDAETGIYSYRARYYDPSIGRFTSEDPAGFTGDSADFYAYVANNPSNYDDPLGLAKCTLVLQEGAARIPLDCTPEKPGHKPVHIPVASGNNGDKDHKCKNSPKCTDQEGIGAIPEGTWTWTSDYTSKQNGRVLVPDFDTDRTLIRSHSCANPFGPSRGPKFCSEGCITGTADDIIKLNEPIDSEPGSTVTVIHTDPPKQ